MLPQSRKHGTTKDKRGAALGAPWNHATGRSAPFTGLCPPKAGLDQAF